MTGPSRNSTGASTELEPLWVAALGLLIALPGYQLGASIIRFFGRGGQQETVEWLTYIAVLIGMPIGALIVQRVLARSVSHRISNAVKTALLVFVAIEVAIYLPRSNVRSLAAAAVMSALTVSALRWRQPHNAVGVVSAWVLPLFVGICGWMAAGSLVSWADAVSWYLASVVRIAVFVGAFVVAVLGARAVFDRSGNTGATTRIVSGVGIVILIALSFRTSPILELYHWEAYVGPMQELRQGGWLLWDAPAQYGVLSILIPTLFPGNAWQSFYLFQAICNLLVALFMFWALGGFTRQSARIVLATLVTATTLFFRPRSATLLLAAQMTPSGGPVRFLWPFVMLAFVYRYYRRSETGAQNNRRFEMIGTLIWIGSVCWSFEAAIYCSAVWFPALAFFVFARASAERREGKTSSEVTAGVLKSILLPIVVIVLLALAVSVVYRITLGHSPDWMSYFEYAVLYSGGFHSLPIDPSGSIWYLMIVVLAISTAAVIYIFRDWRHPRSMVLAGAWGGVWAISSYYVSRSADANLLSIATFLVFAAAITLSVVAREPWESWHELVRVAMVPVFAGPIALTIAHPAFARHITTPQLSYASFTEQIPLMEASLNDLLVKAGAKPSDPVVRIGDGRMMLPAWRSPGPNRTRVISPYSWLPKQYEIIGTLPRERRVKYIDRMARDLRLSGWLIHSKSGAIPDFDKQIADISRTHVETKRFENKDWIVSWYQLKR
ncbi:MAG TPA: hypothetical protein VNC11_05900 [Gemmatimonadaceae bacterium]|nr:hypothetical protein [Gemmatimonadaceae bacterium]